MSKIQISPNASGTGTVTLAAPNTNSDVTLTIPAVSAELITNSSGVLNIGSGQVYKDASGNVGIGTSSPGQKLDVNGNAQVRGASFPALKLSDSGGVIKAELYYGVSANDLNLINYSATGVIAFNTNSAERMRIDSSGNLQIGAQNDAGRLTISGAAGYAGTGISIFENSASARRLRLYQSTSGVVYDATFSSGGNEHLWFTGGGEKMRLNADGNLLVGTTDGGFNTRQLVRFEASGTSTRGIVVWNGGGDGAQFIVFSNSSGGFIGSITQGAGGTTAYNTSSDYRLKENVAPMTGALEKVAALKPCTYTWKADGSDGQGFIAHELQEVVPDCVTGTKDAVDKDGNPQYQGVDTSFLVATLVSAIQELTARLEVLENK